MASCNDFAVETIRHRHTCTHTHVHACAHICRVACQKMVTYHWPGGHSNTHSTVCMFLTSEDIITYIASIRLSCK